MGPGAYVVQASEEILLLLCGGTLITCIARSAYACSTFEQSKKTLIFKSNDRIYFVVKFIANSFLNCILHSML